MAELDYNGALVEMGVLAAKALEIHDPADLDTIQRCIPPALLGLAVLMAEDDYLLAPRWQAAGSDWMARGRILHEALLFLLTPEDDRLERVS